MILVQKRTHAEAQRFWRGLAALGKLWLCYGFERFVPSKKEFGEFKVSAR